MTRSTNMEHVEVLESLLDRVAALDAAIASLSAQQPEADDVDAEQFRKGWQAGFAEGRRDQQPASDGGFTAADMMDARQEGRKEAEARAERLAEALRLARDLVEDWAGYAGEYFQKKHNLEGDLALLDAALRDHDQEGGNP